MSAQTLPVHTRAARRTHGTPFQPHIFSHDRVGRVTTEAYGNWVRFLLSKTAIRPLPILPGTRLRLFQQPASFGKRTTVLLVLFIWALSCTVSEADNRIVGTWTGTLRVGGSNLKVAFNIGTGSDGTFVGTMDSPDQGAMHIPVSKITDSDGTLRLEVDAIGGQFQGKFQTDKDAIEGNWMQGGSALPLSLRRERHSIDSNDSALDIPDVARELLLGTWQGALTSSAVRLRIVLRFLSLEDGTVAGYLDSLDQGVTGIPITGVHVRNDVIEIHIQSIGAIYEGEVDEGEIRGQWKQGDDTSNLNLHRVEKTPASRRPQEPKRPFPYYEENIDYKNRVESVVLAGTVTIPESSRSLPAAVLISGSGAQDRNQTIFGHRPFLVIADYLSRHQIAVLRFDDRGIGGSTGDLLNATLTDLATDVAAGIDYLKTRAEIDPTKIGLIGHSEGGLIASILASQSSDTAFVVLLATPGIAGSELIAAQSDFVLGTAGASRELIEFNRSYSERIYDVLRTEPDDAEARQLILTIQRSEWSRLSPQLREKSQKFRLPIAQSADLIDTYLSRWFRSFIAYTPTQALREIDCPVLALNGETDRQVPAQKNLGAIKSALKAGKNQDYTIRELSGLNHLFQPSQIGSMAEYGSIEETFSSEALDLIANWINSRVGT